MAWRGRDLLEDHLALVLLTKPVDVVQEACQVLDKHAYHVEEQLKSELFYSSTLLSPNKLCFKY